MMTPFVNAIFSVLPQLGLQNVSIGELIHKEQLLPRFDVIIMIRLSKTWQGNVFYRMNEDTAKKVASTMMMGMEVPQLDMMAQSAVAEMVNMVTANAAIGLEQRGVSVDITPPVMVSIDEAIDVSSKLTAIPIFTEVGIIEIDVGIEKVT